MVRQSLPPVDEAVAAPIRAYQNQIGVASYEDYLVGEARRIGRSIFPNQWFVDEKVIHIAYKPPDNGPKVFDRPEPEYAFDNYPGWGVVLHYGSKSEQKTWEVQFQFRSTYIRNDRGDKNRVTLLETILIKNDGKPSIPNTMKQVKSLELKKPGRWKFRR